MIVKIKRQENQFSQSYWQEFTYEPEENENITSLISHLNYNDDLKDNEGKSADLIHIETSCEQGICGACAIRINGKPRLACKTFIRDLPGDVLTLEPLSKFGVKCDLVVDRSIIWKQAKRGGLYVNNADLSPVSEEEAKLRYDAAKCIKCGICLEACPQYMKKKGFFGAAFANDAFLSTSLSENKKQEKIQNYKTYFSDYCLKCGCCQRACPMKIATLSEMLYMDNLSKE